MDIASLYQIFMKHRVVTTDSRNCPRGTLFFALKGDTFNGNAFAAQALKDGCAYAIVDESDYAAEGDDRYILVEDCLRTLQELARYHRRQLGTKVIGITGTNGKTTTKELIAAVLSQKYNVLFTQGNLNNHIGVPLTLLGLNAKHDLAVIEMGASHQGEIKTLSEIAEPDFGIITNVGKAHLEGFGSFEGVIKTKGELYDYIRTRKDAVVFIPHENPHLKAISQGLNLISYGQEESLYINGRVTGNSPYLAFEWKSGEEGEINRVNTRLIGEYNLDNALAAVAIGRYFDIPAGSINLALEAYTPQNNRSQLKQTDRNRLIIDAYNANPTSMKASLENFRNMEVEHKMVILGDMKELGDGSSEEHRKIVELIESCGFETVMLVGPEFSAVRHGYESFANVDQVIEVLKNTRHEGKYILIKGSNSMKLIQVEAYL